MRGGANVFKGKWIVSIDFEARSNRRYGGSFRSFSHQGSWMLEWWNLPKGEVSKCLWSEAPGHGHGLH
jgi:hypothetical protein